MRSRLLAAALSLSVSACAQGAPPPSVPPSGVAPPNTVPSWPAPAPAQVVIVPARDDVVLERYVGNYEWVAVCFRGCFRFLDPDVRYRVSGKGMMDSKPFTLRSGPQVVRIDPSPTWPRTVGIVALSIAPVFALGAFADATGRDCQPTDHDTFCNGVRRDATVLAVVFGAFLVTGLTLVAVSQPTRVSVDRGSASALRVSARGLEF